MLTALQLVGALAVLTAFVAIQAGRLRPESVSSLSLNLGGSAVLAGLALHEQQWGFLLLEVVWAGVSAYGLARHFGATSA